MVQAPAVGPITFARGIRSQGFLDFAGTMWREHGDVFEAHLGPRRLVFVMHPDAVEQVTVSGRQRYEKMGSYDAVRRYLIGDGLVGSTGDLWRRQRKLMAPMFTPRGVATYADVVIKDALRFAERWEGLAGEVQVDLAEEMMLITATIILKAMFSSETPESISEMKGAVETMVAFADTQMVPLRVPAWIPSARNRRYGDARGLVHRSIEALISERLAMDEADWPSDLLSRLMAARDPDTGAPMAEHLVRDEAITMFFAGHETTARTMTAAWYALASNPDVADRLHEELDEVLGRRVPTLDDLHGLPYTLRVVKEVLRLYPAAPFYARDAIEDDRIAGFDIPAGSTIMLSPFYTHRHPGFWAEPDRFDPDRWTRDAETARHGHAYHPFAAGPRICIGNNFSLLESHLLLAILAQRFAPRLPDGYEPRFVMRGTMSIDGGLPAVIEKR